MKITVDIPKGTKFSRNLLFPIGGFVQKSVISCYTFRSIPFHVLKHKKLVFIESASYDCNFTGTVINSLIIMIVCKYLSDSVLLLVHYITTKTLRENG